MYDRAVATFQPNEQEVVMKYINSWQREGIEIGIERGRLAGELNIVLRLLRRRFAGSIEELVPMISQLPEPALQTFADEMLDFTNADDARIWLSRNG